MRSSTSFPPARYAATKSSGSSLISGWVRCCTLAGRPPGGPPRRAGQRPLRRAADVAAPAAPARRPAARTGGPPSVRALPAHPGSTAARDGRATLLRRLLREGARRGLHPLRSDPPDKQTRPRRRGGLPQMRPSRPRTLGNVHQVRQDHHRRGTPRNGPTMPELPAQAPVHLRPVWAARPAGARVHRRRPDLRHLLPPRPSRHLQPVRHCLPACAHQARHRHRTVPLVLAAGAGGMRNMRNRVADQTRSSQR